MSRSSLVPHDPTHPSDFGEELRTLARLDNVMNIAKRVGKFDERVLFRGENANVCVVFPNLSVRGGR